MFDGKVLRKAVALDSFTVRNTVSMIICYYIGFFFLGYSAVVAGTAAVLITDFAGSALHKNLMRLQAVCIGSVLPHIIVRTVGQSCSSSTLIMQGLCLVLWELLTNFVYYSSPTWGYVGCLTAAFACQVLVYPCSPYESGAAATGAEQVFRAASFEKMSQTAMAAIILTLVDMVLMSQRASTMATERLLQALLGLDAGLQAAFQPRKPGGLMPAGKLEARSVELSDTAFTKRLQRLAGGLRAPRDLLELLDSAAALGEEADKEPRYFRLPWPAAFYRGLVRHGHLLRADLACMEQLLRGSDGGYPDALGGLRDLEALRSLRWDVMRTSEGTIDFAQAVLRNETGRKMRGKLAELQRLEKVEHLEALPELIEAVNSRGLLYPEEAGKSMEEDALCRLHALLMLLDSAVQHMAVLMKDCIRQAS